MQTLRRPLFIPLYYRRTLLLVACTGFFIAEVFGDQIALLLCTLASAFALTTYERRRWISVSPHFLMGDVLFRFSLALAVTYVLAQRMTAS